MSAVVRPLRLAGPPEPREPPLPLPPLPPRRPDVEFDVAAALPDARWPTEMAGAPSAVAGAWRKAVWLLALALLWEVWARWQDNDLLFPTFSQTAQAFMTDLFSGVLPQRAWISLKLLLKGFGLGVVGALLLTSLASSTRAGRDLLELLTSMFNPLPAIALLPVALLWFGLGQGSLVFVIMHAVLWPLALATFSGFQSVPETLRMAGRNYGLRGPAYVFRLLIPAALPAILSGLKIGWAFAWRTLIAAELVFGVSSGQGGLGWYVFQNRNEMYTDKVFAGLVTVILIGLAVEAWVFRTIERVTVRRWGQQR